MSFDLWLAFVAAATVLLVIPGPTIALVIAYALGEGRRAAFAIVAGVALGDLTAMTLSLAGVGALLSASATLFTALKWVGAAYLVQRYLRPRPALGMLGHAYAVTALNPKSIVFFVAFVPQFMDPAGDVPGQSAILVATFVALAAVNAGLYALLAGRARGQLRRPAVRRAVNRAGGGVLIGAGVLTAAMRRA